MCWKTPLSFEGSKCTKLYSRIQKEIFNSRYSYLKHTILMFNPTSLDDVSVQATHRKARGKNVNSKVGGSSKYFVSKSKENNKLKRKEREKKYCKEG